MGWRSIHWNRSEMRQKTRFERYADDSWMLLIGIGRVYVAFKGRKPYARHSYAAARRQDALDIIKSNDSEAP